MIVATVGCAVMWLGCSDTASTGSSVDASTATVTTSAVATTAVTPTTIGSTTTVGDVIVTVTGNVTRVLPGGDLLLNDDGTDYTITMSSPSVVDVAGTGMTGDAIQVGESVQIIGTLTGKTIAAQTVIVPLDPPPSPTTSTG
jgi:hypothetical protein